MIPSWLIIGGVTFLIALGSSFFQPKDISWFRRLRRPRWLTFEPLIPVIWSIVFVCGAWSAYIVWNRDPGTTQTWWLMAFYVLVEVVIVAFNPVTLRSRNLNYGAIVGGLGFVLGLILTLLVWRISGWAALLLVPYLIWSPIGTYTTWAMGQLNPEYT